MQLTVRDVAVALKVPERSVLQWIADGQLAASKVQGQFRLNRADVIEWATANQRVLPAELLREGDADPGPCELSEALASGGIVRGIRGVDKESVLRAVVDEIGRSAKIDGEALVRVLLARESLGSTGVGNGIAIPHARSPITLNIRRPTVFLVLLSAPIEFNAPDGEPVDTLWMVVAPTNRDHLQLLSRLAFVLKHGAIKTLLRSRAPDRTILDSVKAIERTLDAPVESIDPAAIQQPAD